MSFSFFSDASRLRALPCSKTFLNLMLFYSPACSSLLQTYGSPIHSPENFKTVSLQPKCLHNSEWSCFPSIKSQFLDHTSDNLIHNSTLATSLFFFRGFSLMTHELTEERQKTVRRKSRNQPLRG